MFLRKYMKRYKISKMDVMECLNIRIVKVNNRKILNWEYYRMKLEEHAIKIYTVNKEQIFLGKYFENIIENKHKQIFINCRLSKYHHLILIIPVILQDS